jgi:hypothetical protein
VFTENERQNTTFKFIRDKTRPDLLYMYNLCYKANFSIVDCQFFTGFNYQDNDYPYTYHGSYGNYYIDGGYYFHLDLDPENISLERFQTLVGVISSDLIDLSTRLVIFSFNVYQSTESDNRILAFNIYIEQSALQGIKLDFNVKIFKLFINFEKLINLINNGSSYEVLQEFGNYFASYCYLLLILLYSLFNIYYMVKAIYKEGRNIIQHDFGGFIIEWLIDVFILVLLVIRIYYLIEQMNIIKKFQDEKFKSYFPVLHYTENLEQIIFILEVFIVMLIIIQTFNAFYFEFFARIFLTFKKALKYLISYFLIYFIFVISYGTCCNLLYGGKILQFSDFFQASSTMIMFVYLDFSLIKDMLEMLPLTTLLVIFSYYMMMYFIILNLLFVLLLDAYDTIKHRHVLTLLRYSIVWNGLKQFFENLFLKITRKLKIIS